MYLYSETKCFRIVGIDQRIPFQARMNILKEFEGLKPDVTVSLFVNVYR